MITTKKNSPIEISNDSKNTKSSISTAQLKKTADCCSGSSPCSSYSASTSALTKTAAKPQSTTMLTSESKKSPKTRVIIKYDVGFNNILHIRGKGANLNWDKGIALVNLKADEWVWETEASFATCEFKVLINDKLYEIGNNHLINCGATIQYTPRF